MERADLLLEILTEELPAKGLSELAAALHDLLIDGLKKLGLSADYSDTEALWTPRRMVVIVPGLELEQAAQMQERRGPALQAAFDAAGAPSKALQGFAASCGVAVEQLQKLETDKGSWMVHRSVTAGRRTLDLLAGVLTAALRALPIAKPMRWGVGEHSFLRPVHGILFLLGRELVPFTAFGLHSRTQTVGHRFLHPDLISIAHLDVYAESLRAAKVLVDPAERRALIRSQAQAKAMRAGGTAQIRDALLDEVADLTEWPQALLCQIPSEFMRLPEAVIITTIESHQKFFPVVDAQGKLLPAFIGVANLESRDSQQVIQGYERVVRPRLSDAQFFFDRDLKTPLQDHLEGLKKVTFQARLGSQWDKTMRVAALAEQLAANFAVEPASARQAAELSRCDLLTHMVGEFPELQGQMGRRYWLEQGGASDIAEALDEVYMPRGAGQQIAATPLGGALACAERLDTLAGIFAIGLKPSGNKDPFSLRRAALGLARTLIESGTALDLKSALNSAVRAVLPGVQATRGAKDAATPDAQALTQDIFDFVVERLRAYGAEQNADPRVFDAVAALQPVDLLDFDLRLKACQSFMQLPEWESLAAANKRISNILRKSDAQTPTTATQLLREAPELALLAITASATAATAPLRTSQRYVELLTSLAALQAPVDLFFDKVMVNCEDLALRQQRLGLLQRVQSLFMQVADIGLLAG